MKTEPVLTVGTITAAVAGLLGLLVAFGVDLSDDKQTALLVFVTAVAPLVAAVVARGKVTPVDRPRRRTRQDSNHARPGTDRSDP